MVQRRWVLLGDMQVAGVDRVDDDDDDDETYRQLLETVFETVLGEQITCSSRAGCCGQRYFSL